MSEMERFDRYLTDDGPAALVIREHLMPVEGTDGVFFPATFAAGDGFPGGYNINRFGGKEDGNNVCLVDSVGSQANRIEPLFMREKYRHLVPQIVIKAGDHEVNILEVGHRAGDALVRCSSLQEEIDAAFQASIRGDASALAKIAPTSLVFGVWNSRGQKGNQDKRPRLVASTIRAFDVRELSRSAVYTAPVDYSLLDIFSEEDRQKAEGDPKNPLSKRGFVNALASNTHGGVIAMGGIRRDATLGLAALRHLHAGADIEKTLALRRYILGLCLVAFTADMEAHLRQGCTLVRIPDCSREFVEVYSNGARVNCSITDPAVMEYAAEAAEAFGVGESRTVLFEKERAKRDVKKDGDKKATAKRGKKSEPVAERPEAE